MSEHHPTLAPSSFPALMQCACYDSAGEISEEADEFADLGTEMHAHVEALLLGRIPPNPRLMEKSDIEDCEWAAGEIRQFCAANAPQARIEVEQEVALFGRDHAMLTHGTKDVRCRHITGDLKGCLDYSRDYERHVPQLDVYGLADMVANEWDEGLFFICLIRPRKFFSWTRTRAECQATLDCAIARRADPERFPQPCFYCRHCKRILSCPAVNKRIALVGQCFSTIPGVAEMGAPSSITDPVKMDQALCFVREQLKPYIRRVSAIAESFEDAALALSEKSELPHFERRAKSTKSIENLPRALELSGLPVEAFYSALKLSIPKLAAAYAQANGLKQKPARQELEGKLNEVIIGGEPTISLEFCA